MELDERIDQIKAEFDAETIEIEPYEIKPRKSDIDVENVALLWMPQSLTLTNLRGNRSASGGRKSPVMMAELLSFNGD
ncbi:MAG: hypothetical protein R3C02_01660 [Planctomycetaceae bacterium]